MATATDTMTAQAGGAWRDLDQLFTDVIDRGLLSGAVALVWHRNRLVHQAAPGCQDVAAGTPMRSDTLFRLYSMTKPVTAVAMMLLWEEGLWRPEDPIAKYLPELAGLKLANGERAEPQPTLEHLMTHQAGFAYGVGADDAIDMAMQAAEVPVLPHDIDADTYLARLATVPLAYAPGTGWRYSVAMDLQGLIVERLSGMPLQTFMQRRIFDPLGMVDTDFCVPADKLERLATVYMGLGEARFPMPQGPFAPDPQAVPVMASGGGGLFSTAGDYLRFARMLHSGGALDDTRILSEAATALMRRSHTPPALLAGGFGTAPHWLRPGYEYAYNGIAVTDPGAAGIALGRGTYFWDGAAGTWFWSDPENDVVIVCLVQLLADAELLGLQFASRDIVRAALRTHGVG